MPETRAARADGAARALRRAPWWAGLALVAATAAGCASGVGTDPGGAGATGGAPLPTVGSHYDQILADHPDFPAQSSGEVSGDRTVLRWRGGYWVFANDGTLVDAPTGAREGARGEDDPGADDKAGPLPDRPQLGEGVPPCESRVHAREDVPHPTYGTVRVFLSTLPGQEDFGCITASAPGGETIFYARVDVVGPEQLEFADPVTDDATGNSFVTYNPGRYDGVFVLIPTPTGFVAPEDTDAQYFQSDGRVRYYSARVVESDSGGPAAISEEINTCVPDCAAANYRHRLLTWDGSAYS